MTPANATCGRLGDAEADRLQVLLILPADSFPALPATTVSALYAAFMRAPHNPPFHAALSSAVHKVTFSPERQPHLSNFLHDQRSQQTATRKWPPLAAPFH